jgi:hypothetical protein
MPNESDAPDTSVVTPERQRGKRRTLDTINHPGVLSERVVIGSVLFTAK